LFSKGIGCFKTNQIFFDSNSNIFTDLRYAEKVHNLMKYIRFLLFTIGLLMAFGLTAQVDSLVNPSRDSLVDAPVLMGAGYEKSNTTTIPTNVNASDGIYEKFVLIRWEGSDQMTDYRLFRASSANGASMRELSKNWQKSTWFCDYSAEVGRDYYYAVMGSDGKTTSALTRFDKGFLRKGAIHIAQDDTYTSTTPDRYAAPKQLFMLVSEVQADAKQYAAGAEVQLQVSLQNIFEENIPRTELRIYLSNDVNWSFDDVLLSNKAYSGFPANAKPTLTERIKLPAAMLSGTYHLLVVAAPEGNILNAKTGTTYIYISN
jgi:hypothetical protein